MTGDVDLSTADAQFIGEDTSDYAGYSVASAGDVNGDGYADVIVGAPYDDDGGYDAGAAYIILGPVTGDVDLSVADAKFIGEDENDGAGYSVASAGDVNGDGYDDLIVGASHTAAYLIFGPATGTIDLALADAKLIGEYSGWVQQVASAGDVNGDGFDDLIVEGSGDAYMVLGPVAGDVDLSTADAHFSSSYEIISVASAGDVNGDGYDDLIIGEALLSAGTGQAHLVLGPVTGDVNVNSAADATFVGERYDDWTGWSVASAGDVNGDGYDDVLVGAYGDYDGGYYAGAADLVLGPVTGRFELSAADAKFIGEDGSDLAGYSVASAGDVNGDGYSDILVGAPSYDGGSRYRYGAAYLILGPVTGDVDLSSANAKFVGENVEGDAAASVASAGDVNGDGYDDLLVGAYDNNEGGTGAGAAYLILTRSY
jgi:hypothetical protein